jgi:hypothetical protein
VTVNRSVVYIRFEDRLTHIGLIREIAFALGGIRPSRTQECADVIRDELSRSRRLIMVDEADRMSLRHLNTLRDIHDTCGSPIVLIGEEPLRSKLARERRLISRTREMLIFGPVTQPDVVVFYRAALQQDVAGEWAADLVRHSEGDFRVVIKDAIKAERYMEANGIRRITADVIREVIRDDEH